MTRVLKIFCGVLLLLTRNAGATVLDFPPNLSWKIEVAYLNDSAFPGDPNARPVSATVEQHGKHRRIRIIRADKTVGEFWETPQYLLTSRLDGKGIEIQPRTVLPGFPVPLSIDLLFNGLAPSTPSEDTFYKDRPARLYSLKPQSGHAPANATEAFLSGERHIWIDVETLRPLALASGAVSCEFTFYAPAPRKELPPDFRKAVEALEETVTRLPSWASSEK